MGGIDNDLASFEDSTDSASNTLKLLGQDHEETMHGIPCSLMDFCRVAMGGQKKKITDNDERDAARWLQQQAINGLRCASQRHDFIADCLKCNDDDRGNENSISNQQQMKNRQSMALSLASSELVAFQQLEIAAKNWEARGTAPRAPAVKNSRESFPLPLYEEDSSSFPVRIMHCPRSGLRK